RLLYSRSGQATVVTVNGTEHVWDLLPRNQR
ncbi:MAG: histidine phosphatase family protein, partial [Mycobacterium sp.]